MSVSRKINKYSSTLDILEATYRGERLHPVHVILAFHLHRVFHRHLRVSSSSDGELACRKIKLVILVASIATGEINTYNLTSGRRLLSGVIEGIPGMT